MCIFFFSTDSIQNHELKIWASRCTCTEYVLGTFKRAVQKRDRYLKDPENFEDNNDSTASDIGGKRKSRLRQILVQIMLKERFVFYYIFHTVTMRR